MEVEKAKEQELDRALVDLQQFSENMYKLTTLSSETVPKSAMESAPGRTD